MASQDWQVCDRILELRSQWLTLISEHWQTGQGQRLDYITLLINRTQHHKRLLLSFS